jgi:5-oxoprolinase (ATP-hydrolysing)
VLKLLSVDPQNYSDAPAEGIRRVLESLTGQEIPRGLPIPKRYIHSIRMGTTVATNALLERKGTRHAFVVTEGWRDVLDLGFQSRPKLFESGIRKPSLLYDSVVEIAERVTPERSDEDSQPQKDILEEIPDVLVKGSTGEYVRILKALDDNGTRSKLAKLRKEGFDALAICFAHSYLYPAHELRVAEIARELGFSHVSVSSTVGTKMVKMVARGSSAPADAYLTPEIKKYVDGFTSRFENGNLDGVRCEFMQSDGGLVSHDRFSGLRGILSGPAGGVVGYARTSYDGKTPLVGFDMGGTSTDVSRFGGDLEHVFETTTAGVVVQTPQLDVNTVAAGRGSILFWENGLFKVGPTSAGAHPGPASYRKGGPLTITDANLYLGRLLPGRFPAIFGPKEDEQLDYDRVATLFEELTSQINADSNRSMTPFEVAHGFVDVANESMSRPIRALTEARGFDTRIHKLASFGGAGGQHACEIAQKLGMAQVVIHKHSSILSTYGMALAETVQEAQESSSDVLTHESERTIQERVAKLGQAATQGLLSQGLERDSIQLEPFLDLRYQGTETNFMIKQPEDGNYKAALEVVHLRELSFSFPSDKPIIVDNIRVRATGRRGNVTKDNETLQQELAERSIQAIEPKTEVQIVSSSLVNVLLILTSNRPMYSSQTSA